LIVAVYPRLFALLGVVGIAVAVLKWREWLWIERLRLMLGVTIFIAGISVVLDAIFFPRSLVPNLTRWIMLCVWLLYFSFSERVRGVFHAKDWNQTTAQTVIT
jgi:hypothetical protein